MKTERQEAECINDLSRGILWMKLVKIIPLIHFSKCKQGAVLFLLSETVTEIA